MAKATVNVKVADLSQVRSVIGQLNTDLTIAVSALEWIAEVSRDEAAVIKERDTIRRIRGGSCAEAAHD